MKTHSQNGFTLVEMAIVLSLIGLLLGTGLSLLSVQQEQRRIEDTKALLNDGREMLIGYALASVADDTRPFLPCPDKTAGGGEGTANDGREDRTALTGICVVQEGNLPWVTLGMIPQMDAWSNRLRYQVSPAYSNKAIGIQLTFPGTLSVRDAVAGNVLAENVPAVILSHGTNGLGAINSAGFANPAPPLVNVDELGNTDGSPFVSHSLVPAAAAGGYFDDQATWISPPILFNRLVQAGRLP